MKSVATSSVAASSRQRILRGILFGVTVIAPLFLLLDLHAGFLRDWPVHIWIIDYYGEYFRQHGDLPTVINVARAVGMPQPVYYGCLLYPMLGVGSAVVGTALALRLALLAMLTLQFGAIYFAGRRILGHGGLAYTLAAAMIWSTYSLTNLYNRGAIAEYFGTGFYVIALGWGAAAISAVDASSRRYLGWLGGFFLLLAIGTHPPTAVLAGLFFLLLGGVLALGGRRKSWRWTGHDTGLVVLAVVLGALVLAPWIYANLGPGAQMAIKQSADGFHFRPDHSDTFWGRFGPLPYDASSIDDGINTQGAPYLETQISVVLLGLLIWNLELLRRLRRQTNSDTRGDSAATTRRVLGVAIAWFLFLATFSVSPWLAGHFQFLAPYIQYVYRLVSHCNAALLVAVLASGALLARQGGYLRFQSQTGLVVAATLTAAALGLVLKLQHAAATVAWEEGRAISLFGGQTDIARDYSVPGLVRELNAQEKKTVANVNFSVASAGKAFGGVLPLQLTIPRDTWLQTNVLLHPWLKLELDGKIVAIDQLAQVGHFLAVQLDAGAHQLRVRWQPDPIWLALYRISQAAFALALVATLLWSAMRWRQLFSRPSVRAADQTP